MTPHLPSLPALPAAFLALETAAQVLPASPAVATPGAEMPNFAALVAASKGAPAASGEALPLLPAAQPAAQGGPTAPATAIASAALAAILPDIGKSLPAPKALPAAPPALALAPVGEVVPKAPRGTPLQGDSTAQTPPAKTPRLGADPRAVLAAVAGRQAAPAVEVVATEATLPPAPRSASLPLTPAGRSVQAVTSPQPQSDETSEADDTADLDRGAARLSEENSASPAGPVAASPIPAAALPTRIAEPQPAANVAPAVLPAGPDRAAPLTKRQDGRPGKPDPMVRANAEVVSKERAEPRFSAAALAALAPAERGASDRAPSDPALSQPALAAPVHSAGPGGTLPNTVQVSQIARADGSSPDLARMVETIARARAEVQQVSASGGSVHLALRHVEFGDVSVRFEHDRGDLAVSLSSPDPDFARAVAAVASPSNDAAAPRESSTRPSEGQAFSAQSGGQNPAQQRGQGEAQPRQPLASHQPGRRSGPTASDTTPDGEGIFA